MLRVHHAGLCAILVAAVFLFAQPAFAQTPQPTGSRTPLDPVPQSDPFFGIVQSIHDPYRAQNAGVRWERLVLWWSNVQPKGPGDWNSQGWFARNLIQDEKNRQIEPVGLVLHTPGWAARDGNYGPISVPRNLELPFDHPDNYWGQFLTRMASEYAGLVDTWIIWNEPDIYRETYANFAGSVDDFARLQRVGYLAIKKGNPNATVLLTGTTYWWDLENKRPQYLERLLTSLLNDSEAAANNSYFDGLCVHQYNNPLNSFTVPLLYRRILEAHGLDKPLWMDESNAIPYDDPLRPLVKGGLRASQEEQANYVIQSAALARAAGVSRYAIYKMRDEEAENEQYFGLVRNDGSIRPAYVAYQVAARELANVRNAQYFWSGSATPPGPDEITALLASVNGHSQFVWPGVLNGVRMERDDDRVTVLWNSSAAKIEAGLPSRAAAATAVDKYGGRQPLVRAADGAFHVILPSAANNTDVRDPHLTLAGGDPVIVIEQGAAGENDPLPRPVDACWGVPGSLVTANPKPEEAWVAPTGFAVSGPWLKFYRSHGDSDYIGFPRSPVVADPQHPDQCVQYFQRLVLEWHPENPPEYQIQRRLLAAELGGPQAAPGQPASANGAHYWYFPNGDHGLGHGVSDYAPDGSYLGFKSYFDKFGREDAFGYPMEPPARRAGPDGVTRWSQRFQAAIYEYHPEFDRDGIKPGTGLPWRTWTVQLQLLGDGYLTRQKLPFIAGDPNLHKSQPPQPAP
jgi:hypothetical protein